MIQVDTADSVDACSGRASLPSFITYNPETKKKSTLARVALFFLKRRTQPFPDQSSYLYREGRVLQRRYAWSLQCTRKSSNFLITNMYEVYQILCSAYS